MVTTTFCLYWDFRWDWGLFIGTTNKTRFLRDEMKFSHKFYYGAMLTNFILRFWWLIGVFTVKYSGSTLIVEQLGILTFVSGMAEAARRTLWSVLRVENEFFNNFEEYRDIIIIPPIRSEETEQLV